MHMSEQGGFDLEPEVDEPSPPAPASPPAVPPSRKPIPSKDEDGLIDARRRKRLLRLVPGMAVGFLLVAWLGIGVGLLAFAVAGAAVGVFAAWRMREEAVLGSVSAAVGLATFFLVAGFAPGMPLGVAIVGCGIVGFVAALDDRLRGR